MTHRSIGAGSWTWNHSVGQHLNNQRPKVHFPKHTFSRSDPPNSSSVSGCVCLFVFRTLWDFGVFRIEATRALEARFGSVRVAINESHSFTTCLILQVLFCQCLLPSGCTNRESTSYSTIVTIQPWANKTPVHDTCAFNKTECTHFSLVWWNPPSTVIRFHNSYTNGVAVRIEPSSPRGHVVRKPQKLIKILEAKVSNKFIGFHRHSSIP